QPRFFLALPDYRRPSWPVEGTRARPAERKRQEHVANARRRGVYQAAGRRRDRQGDGLAPRSPAAVVIVPGPGTPAGTPIGLIGPVPVTVRAVDPAARVKEPGIVPAGRIGNARRTIVEAGRSASHCIARRAGRRRGIGADRSACRRTKRTTDDRTAGARATAGEV